MADAIRIAGAIIAGGQSSRMQADGIAGDKFLQPIGSQTIIEHVVSRLSAQVDFLFLNANGDHSRLPDMRIPVVSDFPSSQGGPLVGLMTALEYAADFSFVLSAAADSPFLPSNLLVQLYEKQKNNNARIVIASSNGHIHPIFGLWKTDLLQQLKEWLANSDKASVIGFARAIGFDEVEFPLVPLAIGDTYDPFLNINRADDLVSAIKLNETLK